MTRQTSSLSPQEDKLVLGGSINQGELKGYSAIAQVSLDDNTIEFAKHFNFANTISSVAHTDLSSEETQIIAFATKDFIGSDSVSFLLRIGAAGQMLKKPIAVPMQAFTGAGAASLAHSSLFHDQANQPILAFGHENRMKMAQIATFDLQNGKVVKNWSFEGFLISEGDQTSAVTQHANKDIVYLAGQSRNQATIAALTLAQGNPVSHEMVKISIGKSSGSSSEVSHIFSEGGKLFGAAELELKSEGVTQIAVWSMNLTPEGKAADAAVSTLLAPAASVTALSVSSKTMRLVIKTADEQLVFISFNAVTGNVKSASVLL